MLNPKNLNKYVFAVYDSPFSMYVVRAGPYVSVK